MLFRTKEEILNMIGVSIKSRRLALNMTQQLVADRSGISLRAVKRMESGGGSSLESLIAITRTLQKFGWLKEFEPRDEISPIAMADALKSVRPKERKRASRRNRDVQ